MVNHASYLVNMSPSTAIDLKIPEEIWREESMDYSTIQIFGCLAFNLVDSQKRNILEPKSKKYIFIRFTKGVKGFRLWNPERRSAFTNRDVIFDEKSMLREKSEMKDKAQGGASDNSTDTQEKKLSSQRALKGLKGQKRTPQI